MPFWFRCVAGLLCVVSLTSCRPSGSAPGAGGSGGAASGEGAAASDASARGLLVRPDQKTMEGLWGMVITQPMADQSGQQTYVDACVALIEFRKDADANWSCEVIATLQNARAMRCDSATVNGSDVEINFLIDQTPMNLQGQLVDGIVRGTLTMPDAGIIPVVMRPTNERKYEGWEPTPVAQGMDKLAQAVASRDQPQALLDLANELRGNSLSLLAYELVINRLPQYANLDETGVRGLVRDYLDMANIWGPRQIAQARLTAAMSVAMTRRFPDFSLELADAVAKAGSFQRPNWEESLDFVREQAQLDIGLKQIKSRDAEERAAAFEKLQTLVEKQRYNPELLEALAIYAERNDQKPLAKQYYADIVALPLLEETWRQQRAGQPPGDPTPRERLLNLWEQEHGGLDGFDKFLATAYEQRLAELMDKAGQAVPEVVPADQQKRTVLVELFTAASCFPCVSADLALAELRRTYPVPQVIVLQFHQHLPAPDPLTNLDSEDRFAYYEPRGTPAAFVDGQPVADPGVSGLLQHVIPAYRRTRSAVDTRLKFPSQAKLVLSAALEGEELVIDAEATDFPEDQSPDLRLRLALVEDHVDFTGANGIRGHEFVVREMLGGAKGVGVKSGRLSYSLRMPLADVRQHLTDYLTQFESGRDYTFLVKPMKLERLTLVGWVQNDATREILHSGLTPVAGRTAETPASEQPAKSE